MQIGKRTKTAHAHHGFQLQHYINSDMEHKVGRRMKVRLRSPATTVCQSLDRPTGRGKNGRAVREIIGNTQAPSKAVVRVWIGLGMQIHIWQAISTLLFMLPVINKDIDKIVLHTTER